MLIKNIDDTVVNDSGKETVAVRDGKTFDIYQEDEDEDGFQTVETMNLSDEEMTV